MDKKAVKQEYMKSSNEMNRLLKNLQTTSI